VAIAVKIDRMKPRIKRLHGEEVEEGVGGGEVLAAPGGHQHHQPIHHILPRHFSIFINIAGHWRTEGGGDSCKNDGMELRIKRIHGEEVEEGVGGGKYWLFWRAPATPADPSHPRKQFSTFINIVGH
jgi:hypothetical protein